MRISLFRAALAVALLFGARGSSAAASPAGPSEFSGAIQNAALDPAQPLFVPTHPRVTTTVCFPSSIGAPDGRGFTEDEQKQAGEYLVSWTRGDAYFTLTPLAGAGALNLNVPYKGRIFVLYFYPVERQAAALACLNLSEGAADSKGGGPVVRSEKAPPPEAAPVSPAQTLGLIDRIKLLRAAAKGGSGAGIAKSFGLSVVVNPRLFSEEEAKISGFGALAASGSLDFGLFAVDVLLAARDEKKSSLGFCVRLSNKCQEEVFFDVASFSARAGSLYLPQFLSDAPPSLKPGESREAYFVVREPTRNPPTLADDWRVAVDLLKPRLAPGAAAVRDFSKGGSSSR